MKRDLKTIPHEDQVKRPKGKWFVKMIEPIDKEGNLGPVVRLVGPVQYAHMNGLNPYNLMSNHGKPANSRPKQIQWTLDKNGKPKKIDHFN